MQDPDRFAPLEFREYRECTVMPCRWGAERGTVILEMGVFDADGACIEDTLLRRVFANGKEKRVGSPARFGSAAALHEGPAIYLGPALRHFGHFLLESLARLWFAKRHPGMPVVWSCMIDRRPAPEPGRAPLSEWQKDILGLLGIANPPIFVQSPARFRHLIIPDPGYRIQHYFHPDHAEALACIPHRPEPGRKVWLSRSKLDQLQNLSMPAFESRLADLGWTIVHPETLSIPEQIAHLASAERVAGEEGSALHSLILLKEPRDLRVDIFLRDPSVKLNNRNYRTIAEAKGFNQREHRFSSERILKKEGARIEKCAESLDEYFEALEDLPGRRAAWAGDLLKRTLSL